ncbi:MAG: type 1 glutamine amidotransferase [Chthoniobacteraceae bacterium]
MRVHSLEHAPAEGAGKIREWAAARGHPFASTRLDLGQPLPGDDAFDLLVIMGGAMNIYQHRDHPWLVAEKQCIARAIGQGKALLGVCLGAQLLADALGARVYQNDHEEIGWLPVRFTDREPPFDGFPAEGTVFHWHGDTFELPQGARHIAASEGCANQAFIHGDRVVGLQFHIELTSAAAAAFCEGADHLLIPQRFVQARGFIEQLQPDLRATDAGLFRLLDQLASI